MNHYIQSKPPKDFFYHHSSFQALKKIVRGWGWLRESKPYKGISLTTDIGRYLSPIPQLLPFFGSDVDGFLEIPAKPLIEENLVIPCLYRTTRPEYLAWAKENDHTIFAENDLPPEYKYILKYVCRNDMFLTENEWFHLGQQLAPETYKVYILSRYYKRFKTAVAKMPFRSDAEILEYKAGA